MNEPDWVGRWGSSAVTRGVWHGLCVCVCIHTNPATYVGTITDWIGGSQQNSLCIFNPLGYKEGVLAWALVSVSQRGAWPGCGSYQNPGVSPEILRPGYK